MFDDPCDTSPWQEVPSKSWCGHRYYMAMGASKIVAEPLTITGSIGVVTGKFNLEELYRRVQYSKVVISKGK